MGMIGNAPYAGVIDTGNILDGAITAEKIKAAADLLAKLGYTPVNKAGDTMSGPLVQVAASAKTYGYTGGTAGNITTPGATLGEVVLKAFPSGYAGGNRNYGAAITFCPHDVGSTNNSQAGLYFVSDGSYGTKLALATTDDYAIGSKTGLQIDNAGRVTKPKQPYIACKVTSSSGSTSGRLALTSKTAVNMSVGTYSSANALIAPVAGVYSVAFNIISTTSLGRVDFSILKNGVAFTSSLSESNGDGYHYRCLAANIYLAAGDAIQVDQSTSSTYYAASAASTNDMEWGNLTFALLA